MTTAALGWLCAAVAFVGFIADAVRLAIRSWGPSHTQCEAA
jgi:hypothetical protein